MDVAVSPNRMPELALIDVATMRGLEIGPLANPRVRKADGPVFYLDHASTEDLRAKYAENETLRPQIDALVEVDFVLQEGACLGDVCRAEAPFDYVIASHVVEHIPNLIGWLQEVSAILRPGGILSLVVPDKRYCFDVNRTPTEPSAVIDAYLRDLRRPSFQQMYDFFSRTVTIDGMVDTAGLWDRTVDYDGVVRADVPNPAVAAFDVCLAHRDRPDSPIDIHCHAFTPQSFLRILAESMNLGLIDFEVATFAPTRRHTLEFHVSLRKVDASGPPDALRERLLGSIPAIEETEPIPSADSSLVDEVPTAPGLQLSSLEERLVTVKRRMMGAVRGATHRLRRPPSS